MSAKPIFLKAVLNWSIVTLSPNCPVMAGATAAMTGFFSFRRFARGINSTLSKIDPFGQPSTHKPQSVQRSFSI